MEGGDSEFAKFTVPNLKEFLKARSQNVSGNKQKLVARATGYNYFFLNPQFSTNSRSSGQPKNDAKKVFLPSGSTTFPL